MSRFRQGLELAGISWRTVVADRSLAVFPVLGSISAVALTAAFVIPGLFLVAGDDAGTGLLVAGIVLFAIAAYLAAFAGIFFSVALAACANRSLQGEDTTVRQGIAAARERIPQIAGWALVTTTVNLILRAIEARFQGVGGAIVSALGGLAWALVTFLAVPVITFEGTGPVQTCAGRPDCSGTGGASRSWAWASPRAWWRSSASFRASSRWSSASPCCRRRAASC